MTNPGLPPLVDKLVETGMDTFLESDRLMALQAANYHDSIQHTRYGAEVLMMFMEEMGLEFVPSESYINGLRQGAYSSRRAQLVQAIDLSVGEQIGVKSEIFERVGPMEGYADMHVMTSRDEPGFRTASIGGLPRNRPYWINQRLLGNKSWHNFSVAHEAIVGTISADIADLGSLSEDWRATISKIRALDEVPFSRRH
jgi:hypothetical protein